MKEIVYKSFVEQVLRIVSSQDLFQQFATDYVLKVVPRSSALKLAEQQNLPLPLFKPEALEDEEILVQTIKILSLMEASDSWKEFIALNNKRKEREAIPKEDQPDLEGFGKLLKGIAAVPKPTKQDLKNQKDS